MAATFAIACERLSRKTSPSRGPWSAPGRPMALHGKRHIKTCQASNGDGGNITLESHLGRTTCLSERFHERHTLMVLATSAGWDRDWFCPRDDFASGSARRLQIGPKHASSRGTPGVLSGFRHDDGGTAGGETPLAT